MTLAQLFDLQRVDAARRLLEDSTLPLHRTAFESGFCRAWAPRRAFRRPARGHTARGPLRDSPAKLDEQLNGNWQILTSNWQKLITNLGCVVRPLQQQCIQ